MQIKDLVELIRQRKVRGLSSDSRDVRKDFIFAAVKGAKEDGSRFIAEAIAKGARAIVCAAGYKGRNLKNVPLVKVRDTRLAIARLAAEFYGHPAKKIKVIGVTGTNGKTTVTYLLEAVLKAAQLSCAVIGTVNYRFNNTVIPAQNTTPGPLKLQSFLGAMVKKDVAYAALEVSSHALDQKRVAGIDFHSAIFTNLTQDHLDYHRTIAKYFLAKSVLFQTLSPDAFAVLNRDDRYFARLKKATRAKVITYGLSPSSQVRAEKIKYGLNQTEFLLCLLRRRIKISSPLIGRHNIYNILSVCAWAYQAGIALEVIKKGIAGFSCVPGRLERFAGRRGFLVFVDYAHTEDALKNVLVSLRGLRPRKIITVFGCGGERDKLKRPKMARVATGLSDFAFITNDNPRSERPEAIAEDAKKGIRKDNYAVILDRRIAIKSAIAKAGKNDIVLIAGKGHEQSQILKDSTVHFDDREEVRLCLKSRNY